MKKNTFLALTNPKIKIFSKFKKQGDDLNYLAKFSNKFFKTTYQYIRKCKNILFCDVTKVENFDKKFLILSKKKQISPFKHFRHGKKFKKDSKHEIFRFKILDFRRFARFYFHSRFMKNIIQKKPYTKDLLLSKKHTRNVQLNVHLI
jgi:hypothetical protein